MRIYRPAALFFVMGCGARSGLIPGEHSSLLDADASPPEGTAHPGAMSPPPPTGSCTPGGCGPIVLFGGQRADGLVLWDTWVWDGRAWALQSVDGPRQRTGHSMATFGPSVMLFGGSDGTELAPDAAYAWDFHEWHPVRSTLSGEPQPQTTPGDLLATSPDPSTNAPRVVLFRGVASRSTPNAGFSAWLADTWLWDGMDWTIASVPEPTGRDESAMASLAGHAVLFGGITPNPGRPSSDLGDTWDWDGRTWTQRSVSGPSARHDHAMATLGSKIVLFGGAATSYSDGETPLGDTWEWDGAIWTQRDVPGPSPRYGQRMATLGDKVVLFGGATKDGPLGDTWEWDGETWTRRDVRGPSPRWRHAMGGL